MLRIPALRLITLLALAFAGCSSIDLKPRRTVKVALELDAKRTNVEAQVLDLVKLELPPVDLPGFGWQIYLLDGSVLKQMTEITAPVTGAERSTVSLLALQSRAKSTVRFLLVKQDGAKETQPVDGHDVVFSIR